MAINFKKLNSQVKPFKPEAKKGFIFLANDEQKNNFLCSVACVGSKRRLMNFLVGLIKTDEDWRKEFAL